MSYLGEEEDDYDSQSQGNQSNNKKDNNEPHSRGSQSHHQEYNMEFGSQFIPVEEEQSNEIVMGLRFFSLDSLFDVY